MRLRRSLFVLVTLVGASLVPVDLEAQRFLRGDANHDGEASGSDSHFMLSFLFRGGTPFVCQRAAEVNGDERIDLTDSIFLLNHLLRGGPPPCGPFPDPGFDPTSPLPCSDVEPTPAELDPEYEFEVSNAIVGSDGTTTLNIFITNPAPAAGVFGRVAIDGGRFGSVSSITPLSGVEGSAAFSSAAAFDGEIRFGFLTTLVGLESIEPSERLPILQIACCVEGGLAAGDYDLVFTDAEVTDFESAAAIPPVTVGGSISVPDDLPGRGCVSPAAPSSTPSCGPPVVEGPPDETEGPHLDFERGDANRDGIVSPSDALRLHDFLFQGGPPVVCSDAADVDDNGRVDPTDMVALLAHLHGDGDAPPAPFGEIGADPTEDTLACFEDEITPPSVSNDVLSLDDTQAVAGGRGRVEIPVRLNSQDEVSGFQLFLRTDPGALFALDADSQQVSFRDTPFSRSGSGDYSVVRELEESPGTFLVSVIPSLSRTEASAPANQSAVVFRVRFEVSGELALGSTFDVELTNGPGDEGFGPLGLRTELSAGGLARFPALGDSSTVEVVEGDRILRADSNHDGRVDIADPIHTLGFLFLGTEPPECMDEADVDDDGVIDISDPIRTLTFLFLGSFEIPAPFPEPGFDDTADVLPDCGGAFF